MKNSEKEFGQLFVHHVFFWLKEPDKHEVREKFEKALKKLVNIETIIDHHLGIPAKTKRGVIDTTYTYSLLVTFKNKKNQDAYQIHPIHLDFIDNCDELWEKVVVYDSVYI